MRATFTPELGDGFGFVIVGCFDEAVSSCCCITVVAGDIVLHLPLSFEQGSSEDEFVDPEEYEAAYQIGDDRCIELVHRGQDYKCNGQYGGA